MVENKVLLEFHCSDCEIGLGEVKETFGLNNPADCQRLWSWLQTHCANGGFYKTIMVHHNQEQINRMLIDGWEAIPIKGEYGRIQLKKNGVIIDSKDLRGE